MIVKKTVMTTCRVGYQQWLSHRLALFMISLAFVLLMLIDAISVSAQSQIDAAAKHISKDQIWLSHYGRHLSQDQQRQIKQSLSLFGNVCSLYVNYDHLPFDLSQGIAWVYASPQCMSHLHFNVNDLPPSAGYALSSLPPEDTHHIDLQHDQKSYRILGGLKIHNPAIRHLIHASQLIWVPRSDHDDLKTTHLIIDQTRLSIDEVRSTLKNSHDWEITSPMKIIIEKTRPNQDLIFFFWSLCLIAILSGGANFTHIMLGNIHSRQPEIALRIMLGAKAHHLWFQFMLESHLVIFICLIWACLLTPVVCWILIHYAHLPLDIVFFPSLSMLMAIFALGILLSIYPAYMAKSTNPKLLFS